MRLRLHDRSLVNVSSNGVTLGRGSPPCWSDPAISRQQLHLSVVPDLQGVLKLHNLGMNAVLVETQTSAGAPWELKDVLGQGTETIIDSHCRFYILSKMECTLTLVVAEEQQQQQEVATSTPPAAKRQKRCGAVAPLGAASEPHHFHLLAVRGLSAQAEPPDPLGVRLRDVVCGPVQLALVSNYMVDLPWLLSACPALASVQHLVVVHGEHGEREAALRDAAAAAGIAKFTPHRPPLPIAYGTHHSKAFLLLYPGGLRLIIHTANLIHPDCNNKTQGLWHQDFPPKAPTSPPTSEFEASLVSYLSTLCLPPSTALDVLGAVRRHDFSGAAGKLVASVPGYHRGPALHAYGHMRVRALLMQEEMGAEWRAAPVVAQCSSLGSLDESWLLGEFGASLAAGKYRGAGVQPGGLQPPPARLEASQMQIVWPTVEEVRGSLEGWAAGHSIPGSQKNVSKAFLQRHWHRFGGEPVGRGRAMPHIKTYTRYLGPRLPWFLLASHNLSKAAWGALQKGNQQLMIRSYELALLLLPSTAAAAASHPNAHFSCTPADTTRAAQFAAAPAASATAGGAAPVAARLPPAAAAAAAAMARAASAGAGTAASPSPSAAAGAAAAGPGQAQAVPIAAPSGGALLSPAAFSAAATPEGSFGVGGAGGASSSGRGGQAAPQRVQFMCWEHSGDAAVGGQGVGGSQEGRHRSGALTSGTQQQGGSSSAGAQGLVSAQASTSGSAGAAGAHRGLDDCRLVYLAVPYRLPPVKYGAGDRPWMCDVAYPGMDALGRPWGSPWQFYGLLECDE